MIPQYYLIDFNKLTRYLVPIKSRKPIRLAYLRVLVKPIILLHQRFLDFRTKCIYKLEHNSQIVYLRAVLNDSFDNDLRRIRIANAVIDQPIWVYEPLDDKPVFVYETSDNSPVFLREASEFFGGGNDFIVQVPMDLKPASDDALQAYLIKMSAKVDYYKLYSKNYTILFV